MYKVTEADRRKRWKGKGEIFASMKGTRTGVYNGVTGSEAEQVWMGRTNQYVLSGVPHTMFPNRLSFFFDLKGGGLV
ncbi:fatty acid synthase [Elysia marginata]|uniref:Fatty acid synthase n=1 Tax=Elysia marginata TaxID=1093978 RepID=A0AAV4J6Z1_9GAST|nr:fatty acid synthase [Elysia marginata]